MTDARRARIPSVGKRGWMPKDHPQLGRRVFSWAAPPSRKMLRIVVPAAVATSGVAIPTIGLLSGWWAISVAVPISFLGLFLGVCFVLRVPSGTPLAVYERGVADGCVVLRWEDCRVALDGTREFAGLWRSEYTFEEASRFEIDIIGEHKHFRVKGWGQPYEAWWRYFAETVIPGQVARDLADYDGGAALQVGQLQVDGSGFRHASHGAMPWSDYGGMELANGAIRVMARGQSEPRFAVPMFLSAAWSLLELLQRRQAAS